MALKFMTRADDPVEVEPEIVIDQHGSRGVDINLNVQNVLTLCEDGTIKAWVGQETGPVRRVTLPYRISGLGTSEGLRLVPESK